MGLGGYFCVFLLVYLPNVYPAQKQVMPDTHSHFYPHSQIQNTAYNGTDFNPSFSPKFLSEKRIEYAGL